MSHHPLAVRHPRRPRAAMNVGLFLTLFLLVLAVGFSGEPHMTITWQPTHPTSMETR